MTLGPIIVVNGGTDALTGKKKQYSLTSNFLTNTITFIVAFFEADNTTPAVPSGPTKRQQQAISSYEVRFDINGTLIDSTTKVFTNPTTGLVAGVGNSSGGTGYTAGTKTTTGGSGTGLTVSITVTGGVPDPTVTIVNPGVGYTVGNTITIVGGAATFQISSVTSGLPSGSVTLSDYFLNKIITTYPSVGQNDTSSTLVKGWFKEVIAILELNNQI